MDKTDTLNVRETALNVLLRIGKGNYDLAELVNNNRLNINDRHLLKELVMGICRYKIRLDEYIALLSNDPVEEMPLTLINILRLGFYQIIYLDKVPEYAAVNECVNLATKYCNKGQVSFTNAILRNFIRNKAKYEITEDKNNPVDMLVKKFSMPQWLIERWHNRYGFEFTRGLARECKKQSTLTFRVNTLQITREQLRKNLIRHNGVTVEDGILPESLLFTEGISCDLRKLYGYGEGYWYVQDVGSMLVSKILNPQPGETVMDVCAAPGGKTTHMAELMQNTGNITAIDNNKSRMTRLEENYTRLKIDIIQPLIADAFKGIDCSIMADRILVDAPCSAIGTIKHNPDILWTKKYEDFMYLPPRQLNILLNASKYLKDNGMIVYSTCTTEPEEDEDVVNKFLEQKPEFQLIPLNQFLPDQWKNDEDTGMLHLYPHIHNTDGFFIALMQKK